MGLHNISQVPSHIHLHSLTIINTYNSIERPQPVLLPVGGRFVKCLTSNSTTYPGDRYCLYVEDSGGERHEVECDDCPVSGDVEELMKLGNTAVCTVSRTTTGSVPRRTITTAASYPLSMLNYNGV